MGTFLQLASCFRHLTITRNLSSGMKGIRLTLKPPDRRLRGKTAMRALDGAGLTEPRGEVEILAQRLLKRGDLTPKAVAQIALSLGKVPANHSGKRTSSGEYQRERGHILLRGLFLRRVDRHAEQHSRISLDDHLPRQLSPENIPRRPLLQWALSGMQSTQLTETATIRKGLIMWFFRSLLVEVVCGFKMKG